MKHFLKIKDLSISQRNTPLLQVLAATRSMIFFLPVIILLYRDEIGLTFKDFMLIEAIFCATIILMEIPSGWMSDVWGRKKTLATGMIFTAVGFSWLLIADSFFDAMFGEILTGIGISLVSGTNSAMLYDSLQQDRRQADYPRLEGLMHGTGLYAIAISAAIGGFLYQIDHYLPVILTVIASIIGFFAACLMIEPERDYKPVEKHPVADMVDTMKYALHGHKEIAGIILFSMVAFAATKVMLWTQQPYYTLLNLSESWYGILFCIGFLAGGLAGQLGHRLDGRVRNRTMFLVMIVTLVTACFVAGTIQSVGVIPLLLLGSVMWGFGWPRVQAAINIRVSSERRATILSTASLMINLTFIPIGAGLGFITDLHGIQNGLLFLGMVVLTGGGLGLAVFVLNARRIKHQAI